MKKIIKTKSNKFFAYCFLIAPFWLLETQTASALTQNPWGEIAIGNREGGLEGFLDIHSSTTRLTYIGAKTKYILSTAPACLVSLGGSHRRLIQQDSFLGLYTFIDAHISFSNQLSHKLFWKINIGADLQQGAWRFDFNTYIPLFAQQAPQSTPYYIEKDTLGADIRVNYTFKSPLPIRIFGGSYIFQNTHQGNQLTGGLAGGIEYHFSTQLNTHLKGTWDPHHGLLFMGGIKMGFGNNNHASSKNLDSCLHQPLHRHLGPVMVYRSVQSTPDVQTSSNAELATTSVETGDDKTAISNLNQGDSSQDSPINTQSGQEDTSNQLVPDVQTPSNAELATTSVETEDDKTAISNLNQGDSTQDSPINTQSGQEDTSNQLVPDVQTSSNAELATSVETGDNKAAISNPNQGDSTQDSPINTQSGQEDTSNQLVPDVQTPSNAELATTSVETGDNKTAISNPNQGDSTQDSTSTETFTVS
jgi:hypothetical protein